MPLFGGNGSAARRASGAGCLRYCIGISVCLAVVFVIVWAVSGSGHHGHHGHHIAHHLHDDDDSSSSSSSSSKSANGTSTSSTSSSSTTSDTADDDDTSSSSSSGSWWSSSSGSSSDTSTSYSSTTSSSSSSYRRPTHKPTHAPTHAPTVAPTPAPTQEELILGGGGSNAGGNQNGVASLDLDTCGCPTTFGAPRCDDASEWQVTKEVVTPADGSLEGSTESQAPFQFKIQVTQTDVSRVLSGSGRIAVSNGGSGTTYLESIVLALERACGGACPSTVARAPGPSGANWEMLLIGVQVRSVACEPIGVANICNGSTNGAVTLVRSANDAARLVLYNTTTHNDPLALASIPLPPSQLGPCPEEPTCPSGILLIDFYFEFDLDATVASALGPLVSGQLARLDLLATFRAGGNRGAICTADTDCMGGIIPAERQVRTVQQRSNFVVPECAPRCEEMQLVDTGAQVANEEQTCISFSSDDINQTVAETSQLLLDGEAICLETNCNLIIFNQVSLGALYAEDVAFCAARTDLVEATAQFNVDCPAGEEEEEDDDDTIVGPCTQTRGGWASEPHGGNTGKQLALKFSTVYASPAYVLLGVLASGNSIKLTSQPAVEEFFAELSPGLGSVPIVGALTNPGATSLGNFGAQLLAAQLNYDFSEAGLRTKADGGPAPTSPCLPGTTLGDLVFACCSSGLHASFVGQTVEEVLAAAHQVASYGIPEESELTLADYVTALSLINENFVNCEPGKGYLECPVIVL
jgi:hypothetical protein